MTHLTAYNPPMTILLFGHARELAAADRLTVADAATVGELRHALIAACPGLARLAARSQIAVNLELQPDTSTIPADAELALVPPVSGG